MRIFSSVIVVTGACLLVGTAIAQDKNSGYLGNNYSKLQDVISPSGEKAKRWVAPEMGPGKYDKILLEKSVLYPEADGSDQVSAATLMEITAYLDVALRRELGGAAVQFATEPGPTTLRIKPAITATASKDQGLKPRQLIPVAFVIAMAKKASGNAPKEATISIEYEVRDSLTNDLVAVGLREGTGRKLDKPTDRVTLDAVKSVIDGWAKDARMLIQPKPKQ